MNTLGRDRARAFHKFQKLYLPIGEAESGWLDDLAVERLEMVIDQIEHDH